MQIHEIIGSHIIEGVGIITAQNTTDDVKPGETTRQANKFKLELDSKGHPKLLRSKE